MNQFIYRRILGQIRFLFLIVFFLLLLASYTSLRAQSFPVTVQTTVIQPVPPYLPQIKADISGQHYGQLNDDINNHLSIVLTNNGNAPLRVKLCGSIERVAPTPMGVKLRPDYIPSQPIIVNPKQMLGLNKDIILKAFGNFDQNSLIFNNLNLADLRSVGINYKLPEGTYRICVTAYDYDKPGFSAPLSMEGTGCAYFTICYTASAPQFIQPISTVMQSANGFQTFTPHSPQVQFIWTPPATTCGVPIGALTYDLEIRQVFPGQTISDAVNNPFVFRQQFIPTTNFILDTFKYPHVLVSGQQYIMRVKANFTPMPGSPLEIANQGYSQIAGITYQAMPQFNPNLPMVTKSVTPTAPGGGKRDRPNNLTEPDCSCNSDVNTNPGSAVALAPNDIISVNHCNMRILNIDDAGNGDGVIELPMFNFVKLRTTFTGVKAYTQGNDKIMFDGKVYGKVRDDGSMSFLPTTDNPDFTPASMSPGDLTNFTDLLKSQTDALKEKATDLINAAGIELPFGVDNMGPATAGIVQITFTPVKTWFSAIGALNLTGEQGNPSIALMAKDVCTTTDGFCGDAKLGLYEDFDVPGIKLTLNKMNDDNGTYVTFAKDGFKDFHIDANYTFPGGLVKTDGTPLQIELKADGSGWNDWIASATFDPFKIKNVDMLTFSQDKPFIFDHSDTRNDPTMPQSLTADADHSKTFDNSFTGVFIPSVNAAMQNGLIKNANGQPTTFSIKNMFFDNNTSSMYANAEADNILSLGNGNLSGWYCSIDKISLAIWDNSILGGSMGGQVILPPVPGEDPSNESGSELSANAINYTCLLNVGSNNNGALSYEFHAGASNLDFKALIAHVNLDGVTIDIGNNNPNGQLNAKAILNGSIYIKPADFKGAPGVLKNVKLANMTFQNMTIQSNPPDGKTYFDPGNFNGDAFDNSGSDAMNEISDNEQAYYYASNRTGPSDAEPNNLTGGGNSDAQQSLFGFNINLKKPTPFFSADGDNYKVGIDFGVGLSILNISAIPKVSAGFRLYAENKKNNDGRSYWAPLGIDLTNLSLSEDANLCGMDIHGKLIYAKNDAEEGIYARLGVTIPAMGAVNMQGLFGTKNPNDDSKKFHYCYLDASIQFNVGIPIFTGLSLFGFSGGFYYNMQRALPEEPTAEFQGKDVDTSDGSAPSDPFNLTGLSGVHYTPNDEDGKNLGISAGIFFGTTNRDILDADATLSIDFKTDHFGINGFSLDGNGRILSSGNDVAARKKNAVAQVQLSATANFDAGFFDLGATLSLNFLDVIQIPAKGKKPQKVFDLYTNWKKNQYHMYMGTSDDPSSASIFGLLNVDSYFEVGNDLKIPANTIPDWITNLANNPSPSGKVDDDAQGAVDNTSLNAGQEIACNNPTQGNASVDNMGGGFATGIHASFGGDFKFLMFFANLNAGLGTDLSFIKYSTPPCSVSQGSRFGMNGWYAAGDAYFGAEASVGVRLNFLFVHGSFTFVDAGVAAYIRAGFPNPAWAQGAFGGRFSVLNGLVKGHFSMKFTVGHPCDPADDQLVNIISDMYPHNGDKDIDIDERPAVAFNLPVDKPFNLKEIKDDGTLITHTYEIFKDKMDISLTPKGQGGKSYNAGNFINGQSQSFGSEGTDTYDIIYSGADPLNASSGYTFHVNVKDAIMEKLDFSALLHSPSSPTWLKVNYNQNSNSNDSGLERTYTFTTDRGYNSIPLKDVVIMYPFHRSQSMPLNVVNNTGNVALIRGFDIANYYNANNPDINAHDTKIFAYVAPMNSIANRDSVPVTITSTDYGGSVLSFPTNNLLPNTDYVVRLVGQDNYVPPPANNTNDNNLVQMRLDHTVTATTDMNLNLSKNSTSLVKSSVTDTIQVNAMKLANTAKLKMPVNQSPLLQWYFHTGEFNSYAEKFNTGLEIAKVGASNLVIPNTYGQPMSQAVLDIIQNHDFAYNPLLLSYQIKSNYQNEPFSITDFSNVQNKLLKGKKLQRSDFGLPALDGQMNPNSLIGGQKDGESDMAYLNRIIAANHTPISGLYNSDNPFVYSSIPGLSDSLFGTQAAIDFIKQETGLQTLLGDTTAGIAISAIVDAISGPGIGGGGKTKIDVSEDFPQATGLMQDGKYGIFLDSTVTSQTEDTEAKTTSSGNINDEIPSSALSMTVINSGVIMHSAANMPSLTAFHPIVFTYSSTVKGVTPSFYGYPVTNLPFERYLMNLIDARINPNPFEQNQNNSDVHVYGQRNLQSSINSLETAGNAMDKALNGIRSVGYKFQLPSAGGLNINGVTGAPAGGIKPLQLNTGAQR